MKTKTYSIILFTLSLILIVLGFSYGYYEIFIMNSTGSTMVVDIKELSFDFADGNKITLNSMLPGTTVSKTFTVTNTGEGTIYYDISMKDVFSTVTESDLIFSLTSTNSGASVSNRVMPNNDSAIATKVAINAGVTQTYTMTITFQNLSVDQSYNEGCTYDGYIKITSPYKLVTSGVTDLTLSERILLDNTAYADNTTSKYVTNSSGISYAGISDYEYDNYKVTVEESNFTSSSNKTICSSFYYRETSGRLTLSSCSSSQTYSSSSVGKFTCNNNYSVCNTRVMYRILEVSGSTVTKVEKYVPILDKTGWNGLGLYMTNANTQNNNSTYFFRGNILNNYVQFGGLRWRIVRINENGSVRLMLNSTSISSQFNSARTDKMYVGYMYGTNGNPYANTNPSSVKTTLDTWYSNNLASYLVYLDGDAGFCNDRSGGPTTFGNFSAYARIQSNYAPMFGCLQTNDLFTLSTSSYGNRALTYPIGLITADEIIYAGNGPVFEEGSGYINSDGYTFTMTPLEFSGDSVARAFYTSVYFPLDYGSVTNALKVRPVVNLKSDTLVLGGSGTSDDPYVITKSGAVTDYVAGTVAHYDGIQNTSSSTHSTSTTTWYDLSGNSRTGTINGSAVWGTNYLTLDGSNDWVNLESLNLNYYTLEVTTMPINSGYILGNWESGGMGLYLYSGKIVNEFYLLNSGYKSISGSTAFTSNKVYTYAGSYDGTTLKLYENGVLVNSDTYSGSTKVPDANTVMAIGTNPGGSSANGYYNGYVYSVRIYPRALSDGEIMQNHVNDRIRFGF